MKFLAIKNHVATATMEIEKPWEHTFKYPELLATKEAWRQWCRDTNTEHCFLSCVEGMAASTRVGDDNKVFMSRGLLVDYDTVWDPATVDKLKKKRAAEYGPQYVATTFSDNARAYYAYEKPILISGTKHYKAFARLLTKKLKLVKVLAGFEPEALEDPSKYYDIGKTWYAVEPDKCIPFNVLTLWAYEASKTVTLAPAEYKIPLEAVAEEVARRWPGRWTGDFVLGSRGIRFWDPSANNASAAVVTTEGMLCFTGGQPFIGWRELLGSQFVEKFEASKIAQVAEHTWYDGRQFWRQAEDTDPWLVTSKDDFNQSLRFHGFDPVRQKGKTCSEVDEVEYQIKSSRRVDAAAPFIYRPTGLFLHNNKRFLNIARVKCMTPVPEALRKPNPTFKDLQENCGRLLYPFLCNFFDPVDDNVQLWHFLAWLQYAYVNALRQQPKRGQQIVCAGPGSTGKTFMIQAILGPILGGRAKADDFLAGRSKWTEDLAAVGLLYLDDSEGAGPTQSDMVAFTQRVKGLVANGELMYAVKFGSEVVIEWLGRIVVACNLEENSIHRTLPDVSLSAQNKVMLFRVNDNKFQGFCKTDEENRIILAEELPYFCGWMLDWKAPACTVERGEHRFGVNAYHHPELVAKAGRGSNDELVWNAMCSMLEARSENFKAGQVGNTDYKADIIHVHADLVTVNPSFMRDIKVQTLVRCLHSLKSKGKAITLETNPTTGQEIWCIKINN